MGDEVEASIRVQEFALLKVPYETLNRKWRTGQKILDKEIHNLNQTAAEISKISDDELRKEKLIELKLKITNLKEKIKQISTSQNNEW